MPALAPNRGSRRSQRSATQHVHGQGHGCNTATGAPRITRTSERHPLWAEESLEEAEVTRNDSGETINGSRDADTAEEPHGECPGLHWQTDPGSAWSGSRPTHDSGPHAELDRRLPRWHLRLRPGRAWGNAPLALRQEPSHPTRPSGPSLTSREPPSQTPFEGTPATGSAHEGLGRSTSVGCVRQGRCGAPHQGQDTL